MYVTIVLHMPAAVTGLAASEISMYVQIFGPCIASFGWPVA